MITIALIDYESGNLRSAFRAIDKVTRDLNQTYTLKVTNIPEEVCQADYIVLPGVGAFISCYQSLVKISGMLEALNEVVIQKGRPFLGICVGMQLMAEYGYEFEKHVGFGWISGKVVRLKPSNPSFKVPHMGWNSLKLTTQHHPVLQKLPPDPHVYFVHSYHFQCTEVQHCLGVTDFGQEITAVTGRNNLVGTQFHPEKSQMVGLIILSNFVCWRP